MRQLNLLFNTAANARAELVTSLEKAGWFERALVCHDNVVVANCDITIPFE